MGIDNRSQKRVDMGFRSRFTVEGEITQGGRRVMG